VVLNEDWGTGACYDFKITNPSTNDNDLAISALLTV